MKNSLPGEDFYRAHLVLNHSTSFNLDSLHERGGSAIPFVAMAADSRHGNGGVIGALNDPYRPDRIVFTSRVWDFYADPPEKRINHYFWVVAEWNGHPRMLFINLFWDGLNWSGPSQPGVHVHWPWPIKESFFYPGADLALLDIDAFASNCSSAVLGYDQRMISVNEERTFAFDLTSAFKCASTLGFYDDPVPQAQVVPVLGAGWATEATGPNAVMWASVHNMFMTTGSLSPIPPGDDPCCIEPYSDVVQDDRQYEDKKNVQNEEILSVQDIRIALDESCDLSLKCRKERGMWFSGGRTSGMSVDIKNRSSPTVVSRAKQQRN